MIPVRTILPLLLLSLSSAHAAENELSPAEKAAGWLLLFDGKTLNGWTRCDQKPSAKPVEDGCINPHGAGDYMLIHERPWSDFVLSLDFKISKGCNSGIFVRTWPLKPLPGKDVGYNGIEIAIDDTKDAGYHDTGAIYDLVPPLRNAMKSVGEWNHAVVTCNRNMISVVINGDLVTVMDFDEWTKAGMRPDGSQHKFPEFAFREHPRHGYVGLQDHGSDCWYRNIKLRPLAVAEPDTDPAPQR